MKLKMIKAAFLGLALAIGGSANAALVLMVDLSVENQITISATDGASSSTYSGNDGFTGFSLMDLFATPISFADLGISFISGNITSANQVSNDNPNYYWLSSATFFNIWNFSPDLGMTFDEGSLAFTGSVTWAVSAAGYSNLLAGPLGGDVLAPYDGISTQSALLIGTWERVEVPEPSTLAILALGMIGLGARRFKK